jgi:bacterial/archaeal transporter family protein
MNYSWLIFALLSAVTASLVAIFGKMGLKNFDTNTATTVRSIIMAIFLLVIITIQGKLNQLPEIFHDHCALTFIVLSGIAGGLSWLFYFYAIKLGDVSKVVPIDRLSVVFALLFAFIILDEKINLKIIIGAVLIVAGAIITAI